MAINKKDFLTKEIKRFVDFFGLYEWEYDIYSGESDEFRMKIEWGNITSSRGHGFLADIYFDKKWLKEATKLEITKSCFHEVMEMMFATIREYVNNRSVNITPRETDQEVHRIIRVMENKILPLIKTIKKAV